MACKDSRKRDGVSVDVHVMTQTALPSPRSGPGHRFQSRRAGRVDFCCWPRVSPSSWSQPAPQTLLQGRRPPAAWRLLRLSPKWPDTTPSDLRDACSHPRPRFPRPGFGWRWNRIHLAGPQPSWNLKPVAGARGWAGTREKKARRGSRVRRMLMTPPECLTTSGALR